MPRLDIVVADRVLRPSFLPLSTAAPTGKPRGQQGAKGGKGKAVAGAEGAIAEVEVQAAACRVARWLFRWVKCSEWYAGGGGGCDRRGMDRSIE